MFFIEGRRHDAAILAGSNLLQDMQRYAFSPGPAGRPLCVYGDPAYPLRVHLQTPFRNMILTPQMVHFNKAMNYVRVSVEWLFGDIVEYFKYVDLKKNLKIGLSSKGKRYIVCALLRNALTCLYECELCNDLNPIKKNKQWCFVLSMIKVYAVVQFYPWFNIVYRNI